LLTSQDVNLFHNRFQKKGTNLAKKVSGLYNENGEIANERN
jgi:hypothetical protein